MGRYFVVHLELDCVHGTLTPPTLIIPNYVPCMLVPINFDDEPSLLILVKKEKVHSLYDRKVGKIQFDRWQNTEYSALKLKEYGVVHEIVQILQ